MQKLKMSLHRLDRRWPRWLHSIDACIPVSESIKGDRLDTIREWCWHQCKARINWWRHPSSLCETLQEHRATWVCHHRPQVIRSRTQLWRWKRIWHLQETKKVEALRLDWTIVQIQFNNWVLQSWTDCKIDLTRRIRPRDKGREIEEKKVRKETSPEREENGSEARCSPCRWRCVEP